MLTNQRIYLDNNATTKIAPQVIAAMTQELQIHQGNPSSSHSPGKAAHSRLTKARDSIASFLKVKPQEIIFTSGGTEGINLILRGFFSARTGGHLISSNVEHSSVYATLKDLEASGSCQATYLPAGLWGAVTVDAVREAIRSDTKLIALMAVNNETGVRTDIEGIAALAQEKGIPFFVDGIALLGKEQFTIHAGVSAICFSGHKIHAPPGVGFAFVRSGFKIKSVCTGGDQEYSRRGGTENLPGIIGLAEAITLLKQELPSACERMRALRDRFEKGIMEALPNVAVNGQAPRVSNTSNLCFTGVDGELLLTTLDMEGIAASHGSACASGALEPSRILLNMGLPMSAARSSLRFSLCRYTTEAEVDRAIEVIVKVAGKLRKV